jgi:phosphoglycolate phosphatase
MKTALAAGMHPLGATWGFRPAAELQASGARRLLHHPTELLDLLWRALNRQSKGRKL